MAGKEKLFMEACKKKFKEEPTDVSTKYYCFGGWKQSKSKVEFQKAADEIAKKRGIPMLNEDIGVPLGQRSWMPYQLSHTDIYAEADDLHCVNNCAIQQAWDDIRRTILVGLDSPHQTIERRLGKEVTPETINNYLETVNHTVPGGAVVQEHMAEINPALAWDSYVKVYSGDDELIDEIDPRFVIDINKLFPAEQAEQLKKDAGCPCAHHRRKAHGWSYRLQARRHADLHGFHLLLQTRSRRGRHRRLRVLRETPVPGNGNHDARQAC